MNNKSNIFLIGGFPGAGKSDFTKIGHNILNAEVICVDNIYSEMLKDDFLWRNDLRILDKAQEKIYQLLNNKQNIMVDSCFIDKKSRQYIINALNKVANIYLIMIDTPIDICKQRNSYRKKPVEDWVYDKMIIQEERPSIDEGFKKIYYFNNLTELEQKEQITNKNMTEKEKTLAIIKIEEFLENIIKDIKN